VSQEQETKAEKALRRAKWFMEKVKAQALGPNGLKPDAQEFLRLSVEHYEDGISELREELTVVHKENRRLQGENDRLSREAKRRKV